MKQGGKGTRGFMKGSSIDIERFPFVFYPQWTSLLYPNWHSMERELVLFLELLFYEWREFERESNQERQFIHRQSGIENTIDEERNKSTEECWSEIIEWEDFPSFWIFNWLSILSTGIGRTCLSQGCTSTEIHSCTSEHSIKAMNSNSNLDLSRQFPSSEIHRFRTGKHGHFVSLLVIANSIYSLFSLAANFHGTAQHNLFKVDGNVEFVIEQRWSLIFQVEGTINGLTIALTSELQTTREGNLIVKVRSSIIDWANLRKFRCRTVQQSSIILTSIYAQKVYSVPLSRYSRYFLLVFKMVQIMNLTWTNNPFHQGHINDVVRQRIPIMFCSKLQQLIEKNSPRLFEKLSKTTFEDKFDSSTISETEMMQKWERYFIF